MTACSLVLAENPLAEYVELPANLANKLWRLSPTQGVRGACQGAPGRGRGTGGWFQIRWLLGVLTITMILPLLAIEGVDSRLLLQNSRRIQSAHDSLENT